MPHFDIVRECSVENTFRVAKVIADFDVKASHANEHFVGDIDIPEQWQIGAIVGASGTGKSTIARTLFRKELFNGFEWGSRAVVDEMPKDVPTDEIERMFYAVGFGSVPCWLKPFNVLSTGEKMRVEIARALLTFDYVVFDEFTSVVDRDVAKTACIAIQKAIRRHPEKRFVAVTCHSDIVPWLQPDWAFSTDNMRNFRLPLDQKRDSESARCLGGSGRSFADIII